MTLAQRPASVPASAEHQVLWLVRLGLLTAALVAAAWTTADPDLWGHVLFGRDIVQARTLASADPYSFTSDRPWVNHEWLAEVAMYAAFALGGAIGLVGLKLLVLGAVLACMLARFRQFDWSPIPHDALIVVALIGMLPRYHPVRPQLFSLVLFAGLLLTLTLIERGHGRLRLLVPGIFALWANLHGGFLVGLGVLALWLGVRLLQNPRQWRPLVATGLAALAATLVTPYGTGLWQFLSETVGVNRPVIQDWRPMWAVGGVTLAAWLGVVATAAAAIVRTRGRVDPASLVVVALLALASLRVSRIDAFFAIAVVMLLGPAFSMRNVSPAPAHHPWWAWVAAALVAAAGAHQMARRSSCIEMSRYPEPQAVRFLATQHGRMISYFNWGEYAIWHLPHLRVSMDGRRETVYSEALVDEHLRLYDDEPGGTALVERLMPDLVWLPSHLPAIARLVERGWHVRFKGPESTALSTRAGEPLVVAETSSPRCFPGP